MHAYNHHTVCPGPVFPYYWAVPVIVVAVVLLLGFSTLILVKLIIVIKVNFFFKLVFFCV